MMQIYLPFIASALYLAVLFVPTRLRTLGAMLSALAWLVHGVTLWGSVFASDSLRVGFAVMLSSALLGPTGADWMARSVPSTLEALRVFAFFGVLKYCP